MNKTLIIWDFDGVISDTEKLWLENRRQLLNQKFNLNWDFTTVNHHLGGMSEKTKKEVLQRMGLPVDDNFTAEALKMDMAVMKQGIEPTPGIEEIFKMKSFDQCIATGGTKDKTFVKIEAVGIGKYFLPKQIFTADMVEHGKPEPDLFLLAAQKMGYQPQNCIVIEDSLAGMTAGLKAGMKVIAFLGCEMNHGQTYLDKVKALGIKNIFYHMDEIKQFLVDFQAQKN